MVSATTLRDGVPHDPACVLEAGDHPFIQHRSYLAYRHMRIDSSAHVETMVNRAVWKPHDPCAGELLHRILVGVCQSRLTPREYKNLFLCR